MLTEAISPLVRVNVPGSIVGRFSGDPQWPVLGDHCGEEPLIRVTTVGLGEYTINDAENHLTTTAGVTCAYDGDGKRLTKSNGTMYWYGASSDPLIETDLSNNLKSHYIFFNGQRVGSQNSSNAVNCYFADHLGTARLVFSVNGDDQSDFYPFGGERVMTTGAGNHYKFTGKERDSETDLDNFGARFNSSAIGRFMSPDAKIPTFNHLLNPQKWNKYGYALNNPLIYVDLDRFQEISFSHGVQVIASAFKAKVEAGVGVEYGVHAGPAKLKVGGAVKGEKISGRQCRDLCFEWRLPPRKL
jgi:RHS repeat-associated protein